MTKVQPVSIAPPLHTHAHRPSRQTSHVVFIGEAGAGKSSVINLFADRECATTSPDAAPCTRDFAWYDVTTDDPEITYRLWDTPGLNEARGFGPFRRSARTNALKKFLRERHRLGELDVLVFCFRGRANSALARLYRIFGRPARQIAIPVVIAVTNLEGSQPTMDAWWQMNEKKLRELELVFDDHACVTCVPNHNRRWASREEIRLSVSTACLQTRPTPTQEYILDNRNCVVC